MNLSTITKQIFLLVLVNLFSCSKSDQLQRNELFYNNDFESGDLDAISGAQLMTYNNTTVLGNYNNDGFTFHIDNIENHDYVFISFDLYIHGSWDGNLNGFKTDDKPDLWTIDFKPDMGLHNDPYNNKFITTFSNSPCFSTYCLRQSYPDNYPTENTPKLGSFLMDLDEVCSNSFFGGKTTQYKIEKTFRSSGNAVVFSIYDKLYQPNAIDKDGIPQMKCDESWSIDNLRVRILKYN